MLEEQLLEQKINECKERFNQLSALIKGLQKEYDFEIRSEKKLRIAARLKEREQERQTLEEE